MKKQIFLVVIIVLIISCTKESIKSENLNLQGQEVCVPFHFQDTYKFPIIPGSEEWKLLNSLDKKVNACQIPDDILSTICTHALIETLLNYPLLLDYGAFSSYQSGFKRIKSENNGFDELYRRDDLFDAMIERYNFLSFDCKADIYPPFIVGKAAPLGIAIQTYELFLFQDELIDNISDDEKNLLFKLVYEKHLAKVEPKFFTHDKIVSAGILGKIMYKMDYTPFVEECIKNDGVKSHIEYLQAAPSAIPIDIITNFAMEYADTIN